MRKQSIIFLVVTHNQNITLSKIADKTDNSILLGMDNFKDKSLDGYVPSFLFYLIGWICVPHSIFQPFSVKDKYQRVALTKRLERVLVSGSSVFAWRILFWFWKPRMIVISNDHNHWTRSAVKAAREFGSQFIVASVDCIQHEGKYFPYCNNKILREINLFDWLQRLEDLGAGEILVNDVTRDGTMSGANIDLAKLVVDAVDVAVVFAGGISSPDNLAMLIQETDASAVGVSSLFHFTDYSPEDCRNALRKRGIASR